ncbi:hypothetical protein FV228_01340 [Methylobacterium sp. WL18]|uniref:hypothetical protein n=1 Tax=Methylobacterium sp. WL18 TaxID=2603897 RepID=UPI0011C7B137|nr:hypothetical protein [Methylobacterium sp. WL18]TXN76170.1 hypothetical protein FV228_01340 [Methylobacterium sp. WL18]
MTNVVAFPLRRMPLIDRRIPPGTEVILAPLADQWVAWVRTPAGRLVALEYTSIRDHALSDARIYAARFSIPLTIRDTPLGAAGAADMGEVYIWPNPEDSGCWGVEHVSASGDSSAILATALSFDEAVNIARTEAKRLGATFNDGTAPLGGSAA